MSSINLMFTWGGIKEEESWVECYTDAFENLKTIGHQDKLII